MPWRVALVDLGGGEVYATLALVDGHLRVGLGVGLGGSLGAGEPEVHVEVEVAIADVPLDGAAPPVVLPRATAVLRVDGPGGAALVDVPTVVKVGSLRAGLAWDGTTLAPTLELLDDRLGTTPYDRLDLTNVDSVEAAATNLVVDAIDQALGSDVGRRLAAIAGLVAPEDPANPGAALPGWTHHLDLTRLVMDPAGRDRRRTTATCCSTPTPGPTCCARSGCSSAWATWSPGRGPPPTRGRDHRRGGRAGAASWPHGTRLARTTRRCTSCVSGCASPRRPVVHARRWSARS